MKCFPNEPVPPVIKIFLLSNKINDLGLKDYVPMDFSKIYLRLQDFTNSQKKISILKQNNEKKIQKK